MAKTHRLWMSAAVMVACVSLPTNSTVFASEDESTPRETPATQSTSSTEEHAATLDLSVKSLPAFVKIANGTQRPVTITPSSSSALAGQIYQGRPYRMNHDGSIAALMIGAAAAIAGTAVLVYANRPECSTNQFAGGCGYGAKVIGGSVLSAGVVGLFVGALTWR